MGFSDQGIDRTDFERKKLALRQRQREIDTQLANNREGDDNFKNTLISLLHLMSNAYDLFLLFLECTSEEEWCAREDSNP